MKKFMSIVMAAILLAALLSCFKGNEWDEKKPPTVIKSENSAALTVMDDISPQLMYEEGGVSYAFHTSGQHFERYNGYDFEKFYSVGVNIGSGKPNTFPGEMGILREEYLRWLEEIADMNANSIRVYTVLSPDFYDAFYIYNRSHEKKLYLFQGCWLDESILAESGDAYMTIDEVKRDLKDLVDIFHGNAKIKPRTGHAGGVYTRDISNYVAGWILGIEPDAEMVMTTNKNHPEKTSYDGTCLMCENVQPFETFWCEIGDYALSYETQNYRTQRMVSFTSWPTADVMSHPNDPMPEMEDAVSLSVEEIKSKENFKPGVFASYHIYSYYPNFMFEDLPYKYHVDENGNRNPYQAYLEDLKKHHEYPILVAEFGLPASRGVTHVNPITGYDQGHLNETEQGEKLVSMFKNIKDAGYAGALVFTWQDEWFKRTWNTMDYNEPDRRPFWSDVQTSEQHFGLMEFVSAELDPIPVIDGRREDWTAEDIVFDSGSGAKVYAKVDSSYFYIMTDIEGADYNESGNLVYFDIAPDYGGEVYGGKGLGCAADYVLDINGKEQSRIMVHEQSDIYHYLYDEHDPDVTKIFQESEDGFGPLYLILDRKLYLPYTNTWVPVQRVETGALRFGTTDQSRDDFDSLTDFCYNGNIFEARIPWQLLGFRDPSRKMIQNNFLDTDILDGVPINGIKIGLITPEGNQGRADFTWNNWEYAETKDRLRQSYYIIQDYLSKEN